MILYSHALSNSQEKVARAKEDIFK